MVVDAAATLLETSERGRLARLVIGLLLLLPGLAVYGMVQLKPALDTLAYSQTEFDVISEAEFAGMANYNRLAEDAVFSAAVAFAAD